MMRTDENDAIFVDCSAHCYLDGVALDRACGIHGLFSQLKRYFAPSAAILYRIEDASLVDTVRLMVVVAHCDDAEIWAGGAIIKHTEAGMPVLIMVVTGSGDDLRGHEQRAAAQLTGSDVVFGGARDRFVAVEPHIVDQVATTDVRVPAPLFNHTLA